MGGRKCRYRCYGDGFDVGNSCGAAENTNISWEWGLQAGFSSFAFQRLDQGSLFTANVSTCIQIIKFINEVYSFVSESQLTLLHNSYVSTDKRFATVIKS